MTELSDYKRIVEKPTLEGYEAEIARLHAWKTGILVALKARGLFAFEHVDGTFTINDR